MNEHENTTTPNLWNTMKAVLRGRFIAIQAYLKKQEKSQMNNLTLQLKPSCAHAATAPWMWGCSYMQVRKQQLELDMEQQTGSK